MLKHPTNKNLTIIENDTFLGLPLIANVRNDTYYQYIKQNLESNKRVMDDALSTHPRTLAIRVDLRFPDDYLDPDNPTCRVKTEITLFIESFKNKVMSEQLKCSRNGKRVHPCRVSYIWVCEYGVGDDDKPHYHLVLFLNNDMFRSLGKKTTSRESSRLVNMIVQAWESALGVSFRHAWNLVHIPKSACYRLKASDNPENDEEYCSLYKRLSYMAKDKSKNYGTGRNSYGCSRRRQ